MNYHQNARITLKQREYIRKSEESIVSDFTDRSLYLKKDRYDEAGEDRWEAMKYIRDNCIK